MSASRFFRTVGDVVWRPSRRAMRGLAMADIVVNAGIMVTGAAVRVTGSGLGCPTWPNCTPDSLVPRAATNPTIHTAVEFGNRLLTFLVIAVGVACLIAALRLRHGPGGLRRPDLVKLASIQPFYVVFQAIVGGLTVLTKLNPAVVSVHFLLSVPLLAAAFALYARAGEGDGPPVSAVRGEIRWLGRGLVAAALALIIAGSVVTGAGPHGGDPAAPRYGFNIQDVAQLHVDIVWITVGLTFALLLALRLTNAPARATRAALILFGVEMAQGVVGYVQYFLGVPEALVILHVLGATLVWIATLNVYFTLRTRTDPPPAEPTPAPAEASVEPPTPPTGPPARLAPEAARREA